MSKQRCAAVGSAESQLCVTVPRAEVGELNIMRLMFPSLMLAEIADKMPTVQDLWFLWLVISAFLVAFTVCLTCWRKWFGLIPVFLALGASLLGYRPDLEEATIEELGIAYLAHHYVSAFVPTITASLAWLIVVNLRRRRSHE